VEFLRGPSSVLYGQGSVGGVLNLTSKRPQAERCVRCRYSWAATAASRLPAT
jgi:outer membrane receptor for ferrienterochelin and colicin